VELDDGVAMRSSSDAISLVGMARLNDPDAVSAEYATPIII
jgi:hypothetical protein